MMSGAAGSGLTAKGFIKLDSTKRKQPRDVTSIPVSDFRLIIVTGADASYDRGDTVHVLKLYEHLRNRRPTTLLHRGIAKVFRGTIATGQELDSWSNLFKVLAYHAFLVCWFLAKVSRPCVVYCRDWSVALAALLVKPFRGFAVVYEVNGMVCLQMPLVSKKSIAQATSALQAVVLRRADRIVTVTQRLGETISKAIARDRRLISVVPNGADIGPVSNQDEARRELRLPPQSCVIGFVGNLTAWQGVDRLLHAFQIVLSQQGEGSLIIVGDGPERMNLEEEAMRLGIRSRVTFTGHVPHHLALKYISAFDVGVVPLSNRPLYEHIGRSPLKAYEYMACARPIVAGAFPGLTEEILEAGCGIIAGEDSPAALAEAIVKLIREPLLGEEMGLAGRMYVERGHSWESVARKVELVCEQARHYEVSITGEGA